MLAQLPVRCSFRTSVRNGSRNPNITGSSCSDRYLPKRLPEPPPPSSSTPLAARSRQIDIAIFDNPLHAAPCSRTPRDSTCPPRASTPCSKRGSRPFPANGSRDAAEKPPRSDRFAALPYPSSPNGKQCPATKPPRNPRRPVSPRPPSGPPPPFAANLRRCNQLDIGCVWRMVSFDGQNN